MDRNQNLFLARVCEQAERYEDMLVHVRALVSMGTTNRSALARTVDCTSKCGTIFSIFLEVLVQAHDYLNS